MGVWRLPGVRGGRSWLRAGVLELLLGAHGVPGDTLPVLTAAGLTCVLAGLPVQHALQAVFGGLDEFVCPEEVLRGLHADGATVGGRLVVLCLTQVARGGPHAPLAGVLLRVALGGLDPRLLLLGVLGLWLPLQLRLRLRLRL